MRHSLGGRVVSRSKVFGTTQRAPLQASRLGLGRLVFLSYRVPMHHVPPSFDVVGPPILVVEIIGVFPNILSQDRGVAVHQRAILVWCGYNLELPASVFD